MSERAEADTVAVDIQDGIAWVRFNRPEKRNCMSPKLNRQMLRILNELEFRDDVGVLVLTGEGAAWSAGMDLKEYFRNTEAQDRKSTRLNSSHVSISYAVFCLKKKKESASTGCSSPGRRGPRRPPS